MSNTSSLTVAPERTPAATVGGFTGRALPEVVGVDVRSGWEHGFVYFFVILPFVALVLGIAFAVEGHGISWLAAGLAVGFFALSGHGVTVGFHRYLTHGGFKAARPLRIALAVAGSMSIQGSVLRWVADHRQHHAYADKPGDPHSPWRFGSTPTAVMKGFAWAHVGWVFDRRQTPATHFVPDLLADPDIVRVSRLFPLWAALSVLGPPAIAFGVTGGSWSAALQALIWASLVRIFVLHHTTWSINSVCHIWGSRPYRTRDRSTNVWPLAVLSMGESWHNVHHADPTCARHGVERFQLDSSARLISWFEKLGWIHDVRWPRPEWLAQRKVQPD